MSCSCWNKLWKCLNESLQRVKIINIKFAQTAGRYVDKYNSSMTEETTSKEEKSVYVFFVDLWMKRMRSVSRACDRVPLVGAEISGREWGYSDSEKAMYEGPKTRVKVNGRKVFSVRVGVQLMQYIKVHFSALCYLCYSLLSWRVYLLRNRTRLVHRATWCWWLCSVCRNKNFAARKIQQMEDWYTIERKGHEVYTEKRRLWWIK